MQGIEGGAERVARRVEREELERCLEGEESVRRPVACPANRVSARRRRELERSGTDFAAQLRCLILLGLLIGTPSDLRSLPTGVPGALPSW